MKRTSRARCTGAPVMLPAPAAPARGLQASSQHVGRTAHPGALPLQLAEAGERIAQGRDVLALRLSCAALDLQGVLGLAGGTGRIEDAIREIDQILADLRGHIRSRPR